jgi:hypothetical protein
VTTQAPTTQQRNNRRLRMRTISQINYRGSHSFILLTPALPKASRALPNSEEDSAAMARALQGEDAVRIYSCMPPSRCPLDYAAPCLPKRRLEDSIRAAGVAWDAAANMNPLNSVIDKRLQWAQATGCAFLEKRCLFMYISFCFFH